MALKSLVLFALLVLGLLVLEGARPSLARDFRNDHMDTRPGLPGPSYCNRMMERRGLAGKSINTFVHETYAAVLAVCRERTIRCRNGRRNCHESRHRMSITVCNLTSRNPDNYQTINRRRNIVIACEGTPLRPVHMDDYV